MSAFPVTSLARHVSLRLCRQKSHLVLDTGLVKTVPADGARVRADIPRPHRHRVPFFNLESRSHLHPNRKTITNVPRAPSCNPYHKMPARGLHHTLPAPGKTLTQPSLSPPPPSASYRGLTSPTVILCPISQRGQEQPVLTSWRIRIYLPSPDVHTLLFRTISYQVATPLR